MWDKKAYMKEYRFKNKERIKECRREWDRKYYLKNKEHIKNEYHLRNKEQQKEYRLKYRLKNKDRRKEYDKEYRLKNKDHRKEYYKEYRTINIAHMREYEKEYNLKHAEHIKIIKKKWRLRNKERMKEWGRAWRLKNKDHRKEQQKEYRLKNKERRNEHARERYQNDPNFRIIINLRTRLTKVLKGTRKSARTIKLLGCTIEELWQHLESSSTWEPWMTRENYGRSGGWDIDHIKACSKFDLTAPEQQQICCHWSNLQPMEHIANIRKGNR